MIDWGYGFSASYQASIVDPATWDDREYFDITGGSISRSDSDLRQSADISTINMELDNEEWVRVYLIASQGFSKERVALFTGLATTPSKEINGTKVDTKLACYSVLKPLQDILLPRGWFIDKGMNCKNVIEQLTDPLFAPVVISDSSSVFTDYIIAESNETYLSMLDAALYIMNWRLRIDGDGTIWIGPYDNSSVQRFDSRTNDVVELKLTVDNDWYQCPNVLRVTNNEEEYIAYDTSDDSRYSIQNRGRQVWAEESDCNLTDGENLEFYAERRLKELQDFAIKVSYSRPYDPAVMPTDVVMLNYPEYDISGYYYITSQSIDIGYGATTKEEVIKL